MLGGSLFSDIRGQCSRLRAAHPDCHVASTAAADLAADPVFARVDTVDPALKFALAAHGDAAAAGALGLGRGLQEAEVREAVLAGAAVMVRALNLPDPDRIAQF